MVDARDHVVFAGRIDRTRLGLAERRWFAQFISPGAYRDWDHVRRWAHDVVSHLGQQAAATSEGLRGARRLKSRPARHRSLVPSQVRDLAAAGRDRAAEDNDQRSAFRFEQFNARDVRTEEREQAVSCTRMGQTLVVAFIDVDGLEATKASLKRPPTSSAPS